MPIHGYPGGVITANPVAPTASVATGVWTTEQQLQAVSQGNWPGYEYPISRSLRFNSADSAYLNRTPAGAGNRKTWTWSGWIKRSGLGIQVIFGVGNVNTGTTFGGIYFNTDDTLVFYSPSSGGYNVTTQVFRDPSAWYHIVCGYDTPNSIVKLYVNGVEITAYSTRTNPSANVDGNVNAAVLHTIGRNASTSEYYLNGYLTEVNFIDGQALTPSSFGLNDPETGVWSPKQYTGAYGTNGFYVNFSDNSGTTSTTLGKDYSGNGNNWTPNNFSVTAGAGNDSLVDTPTSYGTDTGVGGEVRGNYATLNPIDIGSGSSLNNGNLAYSIASASGSIQQSQARTTIGVSSGKWYWEVTRASITSGQSHVGIILSTHSMASNPFSAAALRTYVSDGDKNNGTASAYGASWTNNDVIGVALDMDAGTLVFYKNGSSQGTAFSSLSGVYMPYIVNDSSGTTSTGNMNFGQRPFAYTAPSGFKALCTQNLPTPTIGATSTTQANDYMNVVTYTGTLSTVGSNQLVTGVGFQPDFTWIKCRSNAANHIIADSLRYVSTTNNNTLNSNTTDAEADDQNTFRGFDSDGFNVGYYDVTGNTGKTYVAWNWKANGAGSTNTAGTITSTVSANTTSGFSIVTYTGTGSNATVGHGLGVAPQMVIVKCRNNAGQWWPVWHTSLTSGAYALALQRTDGQASYPTMFNSTVPTSTVFSVGTSGDTNGNTFTYVAYCFAPVAGYSAFGSYTGNGSTDGPFVYTGFRPRYVMVKRSSGVESWYVIDSARSTYNVVRDLLNPNSSAAEATSSVIDFLSNGFKIRDTGGGFNGSGDTYIYAAFAESPFKYSLAR